MSASAEVKGLLERDFEDVFQEMPVNENTQCGYSFLQGWFLQKFANKKAYVIIHGLLGSMFISTFAYFNGTITTLEKRFKIPSRNTGIILSGYDCIAIISSPLLSYAFAKTHRPRWVAFGALSVAVCCLLTALLHFMYGPGEDALSLTTEYGATFDTNATGLYYEQQKMKILCQLNSSLSLGCEESEGSLFPQIYLFFSQAFAGTFAPLYDSLGTAYMDDNIQKSKTPLLISVSYCVRMLGPALGYTIASFSLQEYIAPGLTPTITQDDSRWLGAWWLGWLIIFGIITFFAFLLSLFPKELPRAHLRRLISVESQKSRIDQNVQTENLVVENAKTSNEMRATFQRVLTNKILMLNTIAGVFYYFGFVPYWIFTPKYIESQYRQSASLSSFLTGSVALLFTAMGIIGAGAFITKFKPSARKMGAWNAFVGLMSALIMVSYIFLGCPVNDKSMIITQPLNEGSTSSCMSNCHCDYVKYSPVCGEDGNTYISACHAGCTEQNQFSNGSTYFESCGCVTPNREAYKSDFGSFPINKGGSALPGACTVNCFNELVLFMVVMCINKFIGATGRASNFLISVRSVKEEDKTVSLGVAVTITSAFAFIPSPIFFGWLIDQTCSVWGETCSGTGNCWLYNNEQLRYALNLAAATSVFLGFLSDCGVWFYVKDLIIFDDVEEVVQEKNGQTAMELVAAELTNTNLQNKVDETH